MIVVVDTREQRPYRFPCDTIRAALPAGDYSIVGFENRVAIERKSKADAYGTIGAGRDRFVRELEKLARYDYAAIVIEASMKNFLRPPERSRLHPNSALRSLLAWHVRYGVHLFFADSRALAQCLTFRILEKFFSESK